MVKRRKKIQGERRGRGGKRARGVGLQTSRGNTHQESDTVARQC